MGTQVDLDQGGISRLWIPQWQGPSVGWIWVPQQNTFPITAAGTYSINRSTSLVTVNCAALVTITLPVATQPGYPGANMTQPGQFASTPVTIVDTGGNAQSFPITINPVGGETIMGLSSITISVNYGGYTLLPNSAQHEWNSISP